ncbi:MAG: SusD/RagB family nutrient-binding outer membrane lipoprotein, partial [Flavitalea sp.]
MKLFQILLMVLILASNTGCKKDFEETNTNKNNPTDVTPDLLLSGIIKNMMDRQVNEAWSIGNIVVQYHSKIQFVNDDRYGWNERNDIWATVYNNYRNLQNLLAKVSDDQSNPYYAVGLVLKSWMFSLVTDAYGDVPYSEAGKAKTDGIYQPVYDKQEDIYTGILADLKKANELLASPSTTVSLNGDVLYGGGSASLIKWRKLANSLRLRFLLRISDKKEVAADMQAIVSDPVNN